MLWRQQSKQDRFGQAQVEDRALAASSEARSKSVNAWDFQLLQLSKLSVVPEKSEPAVRIESHSESVCDQAHGCLLTVQI